MWDMAWTESAVLVEKRIAEELLKRGEGERKVSFTIPINWIDEFDIFTNFRLQDLYGLDAAGVGEYGRYWYVESLTYDFMNQKIHVTAIDLQYLLRQCMIIPHCGDVTDNWDGASDEERMYAYVGSCTDDELSEGDPLKKVCTC